MIKFTDRHKRYPNIDFKRSKSKGIRCSLKRNKPAFKGNRKKLIKSLLTKKAMLKKKRKQIKSKKYSGSKSKKTENEIDIAIINSLSDF